MEKIAKTKKIEVLTYVVYGFFLFSILFLRWFDINAFPLRKVVQISVLLVFFMLYILVNVRKKIKINYKTLLLLITFFTYMGVNILLTGAKPHFLKTITLYLILPFSIAIYFYTISKDEKIKNNILKITLRIFNVYSVINLVIMILQVRVPYFMMRCLPADNNFYEDQITGLIGMSGTHILAFFYIAVIVLNYMYWHKEKNKKYIYWLVFNVVSSVIISLFNDNKSYYILLALMFIIIMAIKFRKKTIAKNRLGIIVLIVLLTIGVFFAVIYKVNTPITNKIVSYINLSTNINLNERLNLFKYALENGNGYAIGEGVGSIADYGDENMPKHFGMSNLSSLTYQGGIIYMILIITGFFYIYYKTSSVKSIKYGVLTYILLIYLCYYTQPFSESYLTFLISLMYMGIGEIYKVINNEKIEKEAINER